MKRKFFSICMLLLLMITACGTTEPAELTNRAEYENTVLELLEADVLATANGNVIKVKATYQNNATEPQYCLSSFAVKAYQNNTELTDVSDINGEEAVLIQETANGASLSVQYAFLLSDTSPVEVKVCTPTAEQNVIVKKVYTDLSAKTKSTDSGSAYVGEWKANQIASVMDGATEYKTSVILLNEDGTGSYKEKNGTWVYEETQNRIVLTLTAESVGVILEIGEEEGKTILKYYQDVYYKSDDFVEK